MTEPEPAVSQLVGRRDPATGAIELTGFSPGPAGVASLTFAQGSVELVVDYAAPELLASLTIETPGAAATALLDLVTFRQGAAVHERLSSQRTIVWQAGNEVGSAAARSRLGQLGRLAVLLADLREAPLDAVAFGLGLLEAATLAAALPPALELDPAPVDLLRSGMAQLGEHAGLDDAGVARLPEHSRRVLYRVLSGVRAAFPGLDVDSAAEIVMLHDLLHRFDDELRRAVHPVSSAAVAPASRSLEAAELPADLGVVAERRDAVVPDVDLHPVELPDVDVVRAFVDGSELTVSLLGATNLDELWLRVFRAGAQSPTLVALAPFEASTFGPSVATALLPANVDPASLRADITVDPAAAWQPGGIRQLRRAVNTGREAAQLDRMQSRDDARATWDDCAEQWNALGDRRRAAIARLAAEGTGPRRPSSRPTGMGIPAFALDRLRD